MFVTSKQIIAQISAKNQMEYFLCTSQKNFIFGCQINSDSQKR